ETPFDYTKEETIDVDYDKLAYAKSKEELWQRWRKQLKFSTLERYASALEDAEDSLNADTEDNLIATDKVAEGHLVEFEEAVDTTGMPTDNPVALEKKTREATLTTLGEYFDFMEDLEREDWFSAYLNAIVGGFDPHTVYFAPEEKERFDTSMSGKFEGIGARLQKKSDHIKIVEVISGGPAWRGDELEVGDEIVKVGQEGELPVSIVGMRLEDAVKLIKGPKGTKVILTVKRVDGSVTDIQIVRDVVELEESYAKSSIVEKNGRIFGVINLPKFYIDFEDYDGRNAYSDVAKEIERMKLAGAEGLVLDLRNNGGGSLK